MFLKRFGIVVVIALLLTMLVLPAAAQQHNLVVLVSDTHVLTGPGGTPTNNLLYACQTFYLKEASSDGHYARLFITPSMSVWVSASVVQDVAENYGQRNGSPATCSGVPLAAPNATVASSSSSSAAAQSTQPVSNPATPAPTTNTNTRITPNLVLVNTNTALLNAPAGDNTGLNVRTCQTYFAVEISADREFYRLQITPSISGWISVTNMQDVAENYSQLRGEGRAPGC